MPQSTDSPQSSFTGRSRRKRTRLSVRLSDVVARIVITVGGIGTIVAVSFVFFYLAFVVVPLFKRPELGPSTDYAPVWQTEQPVHVAIDEYQSMGWALYEDGELQIYRLDTGETVERRRLFDGPALTAFSFAVGRDDVALGFEDGTVRLGTIGFGMQATFRERHEVPDEIKDLEPGASAVLDQGVVQLTPQGQFRLQTVSVELMDPVQVAEAPIRQLDHLFPNLEGFVGAKEYRCCVYSADGKLRFCTITEKENAFLGTVTLESDTIDMPLESPPPDDPMRVLIAGRGDNVYAIWDSGLLLRYDTRNLDALRIVERVNLLVNREEARLTTCGFVLARETVVCGDSQGGLRAWFRVRRDDEDTTGDGFRMAMVHELPDCESPVRSFAASERSRMIAVGHEDGRLRVYHVTTDQFLLEERVAAGEPIENVAMAPKDDGLFATTPQRVWRCSFDPAHPEATMGSLFGPVWYEGYNEPLHIWQSSFAGVSSEMKLGLRPLIFGTLKATLYSMLFGAPLALLAAIYTSEFLGSWARSKIKPLVEMMASLPSVVLGFLAALVFAPYVEDLVPAVLMCFLTVPLTFLVASQLWHLIPHRVALMLGSFRFLFMCCVMPVGFVAAWLSGPLVERWLFAGDIKLWLDGQVGDGTGAWMFLMLPLGAFVALAVVTLYINTYLRANAHRWTRGQFALLNLGKFVLGLACMTGLAYGLSYGLNAAGFDPRGTYVDTYEQRNAMVVGFVMGFAVIPIIYTIADDALKTVPNHLRSASLGCGATPWQTVWRVVIPTAMSGLFSALMIGLGRAVGETMIVLMAGGNTPVEDWNIFNGFRTLAANIAVELPEAVPNSTHFRTLFLAGLTLFVMTFVINTVAEVVRLRFRKRAYQL